MFNRTQNDNGTYNTRCLYCFLTIASAIESEERLGQLESRHICPERALAELQQEKAPDAGKEATSPSAQTRPN
jgi:hypothetical protein